MFFQELVRRVESIPGVVSAATVSHMPLASAALAIDFTIEGAPLRSAADTLWADGRSVDGAFFRVMSMPLLRGRAFTERDAGATTPAAVIGERMARQLWPDANPLGRRVVLGSALGAGRAPREIVGVVADVRSSSVEIEPPFEVYVPYRQNPWPTMGLAVRTSGDPLRWAGAVRSAVLSLDPDQPVYNVRSLEQVVARAIAVRRFQMFVLTLFAAVGLLLATIGVYSVVACTVRQRTREIGVRMAFGARRQDILLLAMRDSLSWAGIGIVAGAAVALAAGQVFRGLLFGVTPTDPR